MFRHEPDHDFPLISGASGDGMSQARALRAVPEGPPPRRRPDEELPLPAPTPYPLVEPSRYLGVTRRVAKRSWHGARDYLVITFDLFTSMEAMGNGEVPIARGVPAFFNLSSGPASKYVRLLQTLFPDGQLPKKLGDLIGKAVVIDVVTVDRDQTGKPIPKLSQYSKVSEVVGRG